MTFIIIFISFLISFYIWYKKMPNINYNENLLVVLLFIASFVWLINIIYDFIKDGIGVFTINLESFLYDVFLGFLVILIALVIWIISIIVDDKKQILKK